MTNKRNEMPVEEQRSLAARVLYESGHFSQRQVADLLADMERKDVQAALRREVQRKTNTNLTEAQIDSIKEALREAEGLSRAEKRERGLRQSDLSAKFKVHQTTISAIKRGLTDKYRR